MSRNPDRGAFFRSTGKSLLPAEARAEEMLQKHGPNAMLRVVLMKPRRHRHHRFFFATVANYYENWPEYRRKPGDTFQPDSAEHLRAWATCAAGYSNVIGESLYENTDDVLLRADFITKCLERQRQSGFAFVSIQNECLVVSTPKSIAWDVLDQTEFAPIAERIFEVLEKESGITVAVMLAEKV